METLATQINRKLEIEWYGHCAFHEEELQPIWLLDEELRGRNIAQSLKDYELAAVFVGPHRAVRMKLRTLSHERRLRQFQCQRNGTTFSQK